MNWFKNVWLVFSLETKLKLKSKMWWIFVFLWLLFSIYNFVQMFIMDNGLEEIDEFNSSIIRYSPFYYGVGKLIAVGVLSIFVAPAFAANSINGSKSESNLAVLQVTPISSLQIILGKLFSATFAACTFTIVILPFIVFSLLYSHAFSIFRIIIIFLVLFLLILLMSAIGIYFSSVTNRAISSVMLSYLSIFTLFIAGPLLYFAGTNITARKVQAYIPTTSYNQASLCQLDNNSYSYYTQYLAETDIEVKPKDKLWWLTILNPIVIGVDAFTGDMQFKESDYTANGMTWIDELRNGDPNAIWLQESSLDRQRCAVKFFNFDTTKGKMKTTSFSSNSSTKYLLDKNNVKFSGKDQLQTKKSVHNKVWIMGVFFYLALIALFTYLAQRKIRIPAKKLKAGTRIA